MHCAAADTLLDLVRYTRECFDPAALDAEFLSAKMGVELSCEEALRGFDRFEKSQVMSTGRVVSGTASRP